MGFVHRVPVLEGEGGEGRGVGKLQGGKVPVQDLKVSRGQVHITDSIKNEQVWYSLWL